MLISLGFLLCVTGCQTGSQAPVTGWTPGKNEMEIKTPYLIRTMEKNGMDALGEEPVTRYTVKAYYPEYAAQQFIPLNEEIHAYVKAKVDDFTDVMLAGSYTKAFPQDSQSSMTLDFTPSFQSKHFVSLVFEGYEQTPALPKGFRYYKSFNYDALNDKFFTGRTESRSDRREYPCRDRCGIPGKLRDLYPAPRRADRHLPASPAGPESEKQHQCDRQLQRDHRSADDHGSAGL